MKGTPGRDPLVVWSTRMPRSDPDIGRSPDQKRVRGLKADDPKALESLMADFWSPLMAFAGRMLPAGIDPQDVVQKVFVRLWSKRRELKEEGSLKAFLYTMVRNASLDELRGAGRRGKAESEAPPSPPPLTPYQDVQGAELQRAAAAAVEKLPAKRREVFRLVRLEGLTYQEAAEVMSLSPQTVANHMSLALADLRIALRPFLQAAPERELVEPELEDRVGE